MFPMYIILHARILYGRVSVGREYECNFHMLRPYDIISGDDITFMTDQSIPLDYQQFGLAHEQN